MATKRLTHRLASLLLTISTAGALMYLVTSVILRTISPQSQTASQGNVPTPTLAAPNTSQLAQSYFRHFQQQPTTPPEIPTHTPTPTPRPPTFEELNQLYGPCAKLPVLMYHHIETPDVARANNYLSLTVYPEQLRAHLAYIKQAGYQPIRPQQLTQFFDQSTSLPAKPILLTFDDGYADFFTQAFPALREYQTPAVLFASTGLMENPGYLNWTQMNELYNSDLITFGNHTWSHQNMKTTQTKIEYEISTAQLQLIDHQLNPPRIFAYPYGITSAAAISHLANSGYTLAFTTQPGTISCLGQRLTLPRVRVGNAPLSNYGI